MRARLNHRDDSGASLILALIVITVIGVVLASVLSFVDTSIRTTVNLRDQATSQYAADGAAQAAVNNIRNSTYSAGSGQQCFGTSNTLSLNNFSGTTSAAVSCTADPSKVVVQCPSLHNCNRPGNAILTLATVASGEEGLHVNQPNTSTLKVHGTVYSNSTINVVKGALSTNTGVYAKGACSGTITSTPSPQCRFAGTDPPGADPLYSKASATIPAHQTVPACTTPNSVVVFQPGYYDDVAALNDIMDGNSQCKHSTWWFKPGTYYFDFHNDPTSPVNNYPLGTAPAPSDVWTVNDGYLVAGTPVNAAGKVISQPPVAASIPGACDNPINDASAVGVQFIFGGDSRLRVNAGQAEICGTYSVSAPPVAIYGLTSGGTETQTSLTGSSALKPSTLVTPGAFTVSGVSALTTADNSTYATWSPGNGTGNGGGNQTVNTALTVSGYQPPSAIPAGSILQSATLLVSHRHKSTNTSDPMSVSITPTGGSALTGSLAGFGGSSKFALDSYAFDEKSAFARAVNANGFSGATISLTPTIGKNDVEDIDSIQLELKYVTPVYRASGGCVTKKPYTGGGAFDDQCAVLSSTNAPGSEFYVQGTTYVPGGAVDINLNNESAQVFRFGVIARAVWLNQTGSVTYAGPVIEVPDDSPGFVMAVYLTVYVCPNAGTCAASGTPALRAKVAFVDADPSAPVAGKRQVVILSWAAPPS